MTPATSRRSALRGGMAVALAGAVGVVTAKAANIPATDAALIAAEQELQAAIRDRDAIFAVRHTIADEERTEPQLKAAEDRISAIEGRIEGLGMPVTMAGLMAITRIGLMSAYRDCNDDAVIAGDFPELMAWSVLEWLADRDEVPA